MKRLAAVIAGLGFAISNVGCQCWGLHEPYGDLIDFVSEPAVHFDWLYVPGLDATRIGHSDWCRWPLNRLSCQRACGETFVDDDMLQESPQQCRTCNQNLCQDGCQDDAAESGESGIAGE